ncbi:MAG: OmpH family outer membrane protein [Streptococcaceae bacterium]|jgi:hypothetical protein|nr:OmpH family outer membrane protein [Streptococcaceae bacterium]
MTEHMTRPIGGTRDEAEARLRRQDELKLAGLLLDELKKKRKALEEMEARGRIQAEEERQRRLKEMEEMGRRLTEMHAAWARFEDVNEATKRQNLEEIEAMGERLKAVAQLQEQERGEPLVGGAGDDPKPVFTGTVVNPIIKKSEPRAHQQPPQQGAFKNGRITDVDEIDMASYNGEEWILIQSHEIRPDGDGHTFVYRCLVNNDLNQERIEANEQYDLLLDRKVSELQRDDISPEQKEANVKAIEEEMKKQAKKIADLEKKIVEGEVDDAGCTMERLTADFCRTNLTNSTSILNLTTKKLNQRNAPRLAMGNGWRIQLGCNNDGNWADGDAVFLTQQAAKMQHKWTGEETDEQIAEIGKAYGYENLQRHQVFNNRWEEIFQDLGMDENGNPRTDGRGLTELNFNGVNILERVREIAFERSGLNRTNPLSSTKTGQTDPSQTQSHVARLEFGHKPAIEGDEAGRTGSGTVIL